ncbi:MAG: hypothetical protein ACKVP4_02645 [Hyphomicrobium sp.]
MNALRSDELVDAYATIRDWLRHGVSAFNVAGLSFGHGAATAVDEAAFLILEALRLPIECIGSPSTSG